METIAVYGSGTIGSCEATLIIGHGLPCVVIGHSERGLERCRKAIEQNWDDLIAEGLATEKNKAAALKLLTITNDPVALAGCTFVFEAVAEGTEQKQEVYQAIEQYAAPNAVIASCTSSIDAEVLAFLFERNDAVIIERYGVGGIPQPGSARCLTILDAALARGKIAVLTTQVQLEGSDIGLYEVRHGFKSRPNVLEAYDMSTEAVVTKLMWILGSTKAPAEVRRLFYTPIAHDLLMEDSRP